MQMKSTLGALAVIAIVVVSAVGIFTAHRMMTSTGAMPEPPGGAAPALDGSPSAERARASGTLVEDEHELLAAAGDPADETAVIVAEPVEWVDPHIEALRHPSPDYRNVSLATVIRDAGHVCIEILSSAAGDAELDTWRVACDGGHAYFISQDGAGGLRVEPMPYFEMPVRRAIPEQMNPPLRFVPPPER